MKNITGPINIALMAASTIYSLLHGEDYGFSRGVSAAIGFTFGIVLAFIFSMIVGIVMITLSNRRSALRLKEALAARDFAEVDSIFKERASRAGISQMEYQELMAAAEVNAAAEAQRLIKNIRLDMTTAGGNNTKLGK